MFPKRAGSSTADWTHQDSHLRGEGSAPAERPRSHVGAMLFVATAQAVHQRMPENVQHSESDLETMEVAQDLGQYALLPGANSQTSDILKIVVLQFHILHVC